MIKIAVLYATDLEMDRELVADGYQIFLKKVGVGPTFSVLNSALLLQKIKPDLIINCGIGGGDSSTNIGDIYYINEDIIENGKDSGDEISELSFDNSYSYTQLSSIKISDIESRRGLTVSLVTGNESLAEKRFKLYNHQVESMEGGAVMSVANRFDIPIVQIRSISNYIGLPIIEKDLKFSLEKLHQFVRKLVKSVDYESIKDGYIKLSK